MFPKTPGLELESRITALSQRRIYWGYQRQSCSPNRNRRVWSTSRHQKLGFVCFSPFLSHSRLAAAPPGEPGSDCANGKWSLESPRSCYRGFRDNYPPLELQTAPGGLQALPQEGWELSQIPEGHQRCWKSICTFGKLFPALPHAGYLELFHPGTFGAISHSVGPAWVHGMFWKQCTFCARKPWGVLG